VLTNEVPSRICGSNKQGVTGKWRPEHDDEVHVFLFTKYYKEDEMKEYRMGGTRSTHELMRNAYKILVRKPGGKRQLGRPRPRYYDNIKTDLGVTECECGFDLTD
jgi:hypothetical protein